MIQQKQDYDQDYHDIPEDEVETRYIYIYDEDPELARWPKLDMSKIGNLCMQALALVMLAGFCLVQGLPNYQITTVKVPAQFLPIVRLEASAPIVATGAKTIKARQASGTLTIYNGSSLEESLRAGFIVTTQNGIEIQTDQAVVIPAANPPAFGIATVPAHAVEAGSQGNIDAGAIYQQDGSSLTIKNLVPFTGGQDASTIHFVQDTDRASAIAEAKSKTEAKKPAGLLARPCTETVKQSETRAMVQLICQYVTYHAPANVQVLSVLQVQGSSIVLRVRKVMPEQ